MSRHIIIAWISRHVMTELGPFDKTFQDSFQRLDIRYISGKNSMEFVENFQSTLLCFSFSLITDIQLFHYSYDLVVYKYNTGISAKVNI